MCGICGIFGREDKKLVEKMLGVLKHRGPDARGTYSDKNISMGHATQYYRSLRKSNAAIHQ